ncbi:MAG TPA: hypothetical protein EYQ21_02670 [Flavobacteriales bacterium]|jgi:hypothetical protein|nr:hypothetical protein [Flavobacteriales bacterium]
MATNTDIDQELYDGFWDFVWATIERESMHTDLNMEEPLVANTIAKVLEDLADAIRKGLELNQDDS